MQAHLRKVRMVHTDKRIGMTNEIIQEIRVLKQYAWELALGKKVLIMFWLSSGVDDLFDSYSGGNISLTWIESIGEIPHRSCNERLTDVGWTDYGDARIFYW